MKASRSPRTGSKKQSGKKEYKTTDKKTGEPAANTKSGGDQSHSREAQDIAIIGMACRLPSADNADEFWHNLETGLDTIREIPTERWDSAEYYSPVHEEPNKSVSKWCGLMDDIDLFDNRFFNISPREAKSMDPQQRILLEETWHCIEEAGIPLSRLQRQTTSVHVGVMSSDYQQESAGKDTVTDSFAALGGYDCILANRLSYVFGLSGQSLSVGAACAASLVAIHKAKVVLQKKEADYALVAGVSLNLHPWKNVSFSKARMFSPDGKCKTFDKDANGYVPGDGVGVLLLQTMERALAEKNHIHGIVKGSAMNHGGKAQTITAPRVEAQREVLLKALEDADVHPESITYLEAHGTGTSLGDPIEVAALTEAWRTYTQARHFCKIGSVKTNIGHLEATAGIAGVIKVLLMMRHRTIPRILNLKTLNPIINFEESPFVVATENSPWEPRLVDGVAQPYRAGVSSFGFGGVNSHAIIEQAPESERKTEPTEDDYYHPFLISARSAKSLAMLHEQWRTFAESGEFRHLSLADICATLVTGRDGYNYRYGKFVRTKDELKDFLANPMPTPLKLEKRSWGLRLGPVNWYGNAAPKTMMGNPHFKKSFDELRKQWRELREGPRLSRGFNRAKWAERDRNVYELTTALAFCEVLLAMGVQPDTVTGDAGGWWVALCLSGIMKPADAFSALIADRWPEKLERPRFPVANSLDGSIIQPLRFEPAYLRQLLDETHVDEESLLHYVGKARLLITNQFTFKRYLEDWWKAAGRVLPPALELLADDSAILALPQRKRTLLTLIIKCSLAWLDRKWKLKLPRRRVNAAFNELLDLAMDEVMRPEHMVSLLCDEDADLQVIAEVLAANQDKLNREHEYKVLMERNRFLEEVEHPRTWVRQLIACEKPIVPAYQALLEIGFPKHTPAAGLIVRAPLGNRLHHHFLDTLLALWLQRLDLDWERVYAPGSFNKCSLPVYCFDRRSFWLEKKKDDGDTIKNLYNQVLSGQMTEQDFLEAVRQAAGAPNGTDAPAVTASAPREESTEPGSQNPAPPQLQVEDKKEAPVSRENHPSMLQRDPQDPNHFSRVVSRPKDLIIRDTVVLGYDIVPSTLRLEMALEASREITGTPIDTYRNVLFENPGIVQGDYPIDINIDPAQSRFLITSPAGKLCAGTYSAENNRAPAPLDINALLHGKVVEREEVYRNYVTWGYNYGTSLQLIEKMYENDEVFVSRLVTVPIVEGKRTGLDPHLLDCVFQSIFWAGQQVGNLLDGGFLYVPFTIKALKLYGDYDMPGYVVMRKDSYRVLRNGDVSLDYDVYDDEGNLRVSMETMLFKRVDSQFLENSLKAGRPPKPAVIGGSVKQYVDQNQAALHNLEGGMAEVEAFGRFRLLKVLQDQGLLTQPGSAFTAEELQASLRLIPKYTRLYAALLEMLTRMGWLRVEGGRYVVTDDVMRQPLTDLAERKQRVAQSWPDMAPFLNLVDVAVSNYPDVLSGNKTHLEVLFPKGSGELFENIYKGNALSDFYNTCVTLAIIERIRELLAKDPNRTVRIIEIGAGTGGTSAMVLESIKEFGNNLEYWYTDIGLGFVNMGKRTFGKKYPFAKFKVLDIEKDVLKQGFDLKGYDISFETNCIHAVSDLKRTTVEIKKLMSDDGLFILNEISQLQDFWTLVAGLIDGWWLFTDEDKRIKHSPLLGYEGWTRVFAAEGFRNFQGVDPERQKTYEQAVLLAYSDGKVAVSQAVSVPTPTQAAAPAPVPAAAAPAGAGLDAAVFKDLGVIFAEVLQCEPDEFDLDGEFSDYGIDSMVVLEIIDQLEVIFGELPKTLLFEYMNFQALIGYLKENYASVLADRYAGAAAAAPAAPAPVPAPATTAVAPPAAPVDAGNQEGMYVAMDLLAQELSAHAAAALPTLQNLENGMSRVEYWGRGLLLKTWQAQGIFIAEGESYSVAELKARFSLIDKYQRLFAALLEMWTREGFISFDGNRITVLAGAVSGETRTRLAGLDQDKGAVAAGWPDLVPFLNLLEVAVTNYPDVLSGRKTHLEVLFPKGSGALFEKIYKENGLSDFYNGLVIKAIMTYLEGVRIREPERTVRILEIGSGTGGTSAGVLEAIQGYASMIEYWYTDIGLGFVNMGKRTFGKKYPFAKFKVLDIEKDVVKQGFDLKGYDLIFETNCIHATRDLDKTTVEMKKLLKKNGVSIINEISQLQDFWTLVAGLIDGWWLFTDDKRILHSPLLGYSGWIDLYKQHGFYETHGVDPQRVKPYEQCIVLATSDGVVQAEAAVQTAPVAAGAPAPAAAAAAADDASGPRAGLAADLKNILADVLQMDAAEIDNTTEFSELGIDSMVTLEIIDQMEAIFGELSKTLLFEYMNLDALLDYFQQNHTADLAKRYSAAAAAPAPAPAAAAPAPAPPAPVVAAPLPPAPLQPAAPLQPVAVQPPAAPAAVQPVAPVQPVAVQPPTTPQPSPHPGPPCRTNPRPLRHCGYRRSLAHGRRPERTVGEPDPRSQLCHHRSGRTLGLASLRRRSGRGRQGLHPLGRLPRGLR